MTVPPLIRFAFAKANQTAGESLGRRRKDDKKKKGRSSKRTK